MRPIADDGAAAAGPISRPDLAVASLTFSGLLLLAFAGQLFLAPGTFLMPPSLAFVPGALFGGAEQPAGVLVVPPPATLVTYQFLHTGWLHLTGNLAFLWVFGPGVERTLGPGRWTVLLLACGIAAALAQAWPDPSSSVAMIGASGSVSGILGAYLFLHPRAELRVLIPAFRGRRVPAWFVLGAWFLLQLLLSNWSGTEPAGVAFRAHVGGFLCGLLLAPVLHFLGLLSADARTVARTRRSRDSSH